MKTNESSLDRVIRTVLGVVLLVVYFLGLLTGWVGVVALVLGLVLLLTGLIGFCPLYTVLGFKTKKG